MLRSSSLRLLALPVLVLGAALGGGCKPLFCAQYDSASGDRQALPPSGYAGENGSPSSSSGGTAPKTGDAARAITEADIVQLDAERNWLYTISRSGTLAVVDASQPRSLTLLGKLGLHGVPFEMYRREGAILVMSNQGVRIDGGLEDPLGEDQAPAPPKATSSALLEAIDLSDPASPKKLGTLPLPGEIADSRIVGDVLYVATYENGACFSCGSNRTVVTTFDISQPASPKQIDQVTFDAAPSTTAFTPSTTTMPWKRSIVATKDRLYVGGITSAPTSTSEGVVEVLDISDPTGHLKRGATISVAGPVLSRWQMDEHDGYLRVVSQRGSGRTINGEQYPDVDTFRIESTTSLVRVGHTTLNLPRQEGLKSVRFDGARAYAITFPQPDPVTRIPPRDPLFTIDLSDPAHPAQKGDLEIPGWVFHIVPKGDRLLGLGLDQTTWEGQLNLSLFDVSDMTRPTMLDRIAFGPRAIGSTDAQITNEMMPEDQDRIQKAFRVFDDGLVAVPYSDPGSTRDACTSGQSGVQLLSFTATNLTKHALLPVSGNPRRALRRDSSTTKEMLAISDAQIVAFDIARREAVVPNASVTIGRCVSRPLAVEPPPQNGGGWGEGRGDWEGGGWGDDASSSSCW